MFSSKTATLGEKTHFNNQLASSDQKFTYFVPRDYAWKQAEVNYPSAYKKLFMPGYQYHVSNWAYVGFLKKYWDLNLWK